VTTSVLPEFSDRTFSIKHVVSATDSEQLRARETCTATCGRALQRLNAPVKCRWLT